MRYPTDIQKIEREKRQKKREEMCEIASLLKIKKKMKPHIPTRLKDLFESRESRPEERKDEASSSSFAVEVIQIETTASKILLNILVKNQEHAITIADNAYSSVGGILQRGLRIELGEASIWSQLDALGRISFKLMIHIPLWKLGCDHI